MRGCDMMHPIAKGPSLRRLCVGMAFCLLDCLRAMQETEKE